MDIILPVFGGIKTPLRLGDWAGNLLQDSSKINITN